MIAFANRGWQIFFCVFLSTFTNLVYPSLTGLVSSAVPPDQVRCLHPRASEASAKKSRRQRRARAKRAQKRVSGSGRKKE
jgi:hypothetical protein